MKQSSLKKANVLAKHLSQNAAPSQSTSKLQTYEKFMTNNKKKLLMPPASAEETYVSNTTPDDSRHHVNQS